ncbi:MAG: hypothetical protein JWM89_1795 [Acidimicrobiales bacterium]|nr:hypothetical protein [Acidimicrobiales bacterium]
MQFPTNAIAAGFDAIDATVPADADTYAFGVHGHLVDPTLADPEIAGRIGQKIAQAFADEGISRADFHLVALRNDVAVSPARTGDDYDPIGA